MPQELSQSLDLVTDVLKRIGRKGVKLWTVNGQLHYRAAKGLLTDEEIKTLRCHKGQIVSLLERATDALFAQPTTALVSHSELAVLSLSQEAHWRRYKLHSQCAARTIASATRMTGRIDLNLLRGSIAETVRRHPGLRTRIVVRDGTPMQQVMDLTDFKIEIEDLTALQPHVRELEVKRCIKELIFEPIKIIEGPLWEMCLLRFHNEEYVLVVVMEHIISDMRSMQILLRDIFLTYIQLSGGRPVSLPAILMQFTQYARWQRQLCDPASGRDSYWATRLSGCSRVKFPEDGDSLSDAHRGWDYIRIKIGSQQRASLSVWSRLRKTTISMAVFTAYAALVSRWCDLSDIVVHYTIDGRSDDKIRHTIGYFARLLPIRVELGQSDSFISLLEKITVEYCTAYEQADFYHLESRVPTPEFLPNTSFNWIALDNSSSVIESVTEESIKCSPIPFEPPIPEVIEVDTEPTLLLSDSGTEISGGIYFMRGRLSSSSMQKFVTNFGILIEMLLEKPEDPIYAVSLA